VWRRRPGITGREGSEAATPGVVGLVTPLLLTRGNFIVHRNREITCKVETGEFLME